MTKLLLQFISLIVIASGTYYLYFNLTQNKEPEIAEECLGLPKAIQKDCKTNTIYEGCVYQKLMNGWIKTCF